MPDEPLFKVDKPEIAAGGSAGLSWQWKQATRGYLSSVGLVNHPSGETVNVSPNETTSYVLILEAPGSSPRVLAQTVVVRGAKGRSGEWPDDLFVPLAYQSDYDIGSASLSVLAARVRRFLQDDRGFEIRQFSPTEGQIVFSTAFLHDAKLSEPDESPRRLRRIAFHVVLAASKSDLIHVNVSSIIEWRIAVDDRWFPEDSSLSSRYKAQTDDLWRSLKAK
jgi:hypothetical protein